MSPRRPHLAVLTIALTCSALSQSLIGFTPASATKQFEIERQFDSTVKASDQLEWLKRMSARPHHVGSPYGLSNAEYARDLFRSWGYDAEIEKFYVLFPTPKSRLLEFRGKRLNLDEPPIAGDTTSAVKGQLPPYNAYSADGDVTAELVYVNHGMPADYETLDRYGISVKGRIVIARYGGGWRGIKPKLAYEHGAVGCIIYSDPKDDGYYDDDVYPNGGARNENGVQRGSIADMPIYPGDPLTPGVGATKDAKRLTLAQAKTLMRIPCLPISYANAKPLLAALKGQVVPEPWRGGLPLTYHFGPGPEKVHLALKFNWDTVEARDVVAKLKGGERPDEWIIRGNHYDGWVFGANDPLSGAVAMMAEAKSVGELAKSGWKPKRTIMYCLWDGEEPGLLGSTEWVETHADEIKEHAALYINSDENGRGYFGAGGSHTLERFIGEVERDVQDPETHVSLFERAQARAIVGGDETARTKTYFSLGALGSGSDFTPFLQHAGIAALDVGFGGEGHGGGQYHSAYDSFDFYTKFGDPGLAYGVALTKTSGRITLRAANADVLPFEVKTFTSTLEGYVDELQKLVETMRKETEETNRRIQDGTIRLTIDPRDPQRVPKTKDPVPHLDFAPLLNAMEKLKAATKRAEVIQIPTAIQEQEFQDGLLANAERSLLMEQGLPGRPWFKHFIYAPGKNTGYGVKTLPGIREAIEARDWKEADEQIKLAAKVIETYAARL